MSGRIYIGPAWAHLGSLYDDRLADLEDLRAYCKTGRHPKEEMRRAKLALATAESIASRKLSSSSSSMREAA